MKNTKPVFVVKCPTSMEQADICQLGETLTNMMHDYHVLLLPNDEPDILFEAFYPSDFDEKIFEDFKEAIMVKWEEIKESSQDDTWSTGRD